MQITYPDPPAATLSDLYAETLFLFTQQGVRYLWLVPDASNLPQGPPFTIPCLRLEGALMVWLPRDSVVKPLPFRIVAPPIVGPVVPPPPSPFP